MYETFFPKVFILNSHCTMTKISQRIKNAKEIFLLNSHAAAREIDKLFPLPVAHRHMSKMKYASITVFFVFFSRTLAKTGFEGCTKLNTYYYNYVKLYPIDILKSQNNLNPLIFRLEFHVKAASNAHILLTGDEDIDDGTSYEIVIGGGQNSFSQIRLYRRGNKASQATPGILSPIEYKGFWIEVKSGRLILVGEIGQTDPFLFWVGPNESFNVKYFSLSTWNNVKGEWYYNCENKSSLDPENMEEEANMTDNQRLMNDLLTFLNPEIIPRRGNPDEAIDLHLEVTYFFLDERRGELSLSGTAFVKWMDWQLTWEPAIYGGLKYFYVTPYQIWTPVVEVLNSLEFEKNFLLFLSGNAHVNNNGEISWRVPFHSVSVCQLGYLIWPFDVHNCTLLFGFQAEYLKINVKNVSMLRIPKSEWELQKVDEEDMVILNIDYLGTVVQMSFRRREPSYEFLLLPPFLGAAILTLTSFWFRPDSSTKLFLNCGSISISILILMSSGERISNLATITPKIVLLYSWSVLIMCVPIILYVVLKYIPLHIHLPHCLSLFLNSSVMKTLFFLPENMESELNCAELREQKERSITGMRLVMLIERFLFLIYLGIVMVPFIAFLTKFEMINF